MNANVSQSIGTPGRCGSGKAPRTLDRSPTVCVGKAIAATLTTTIATSDDGTFFVSRGSR